jgi:hypothetical protein
LLRAAIASTLLIATPYAFGQSVSATLRGQVTADTAPASGATVTATNTATGLSRTVQTGTTGNYSLAGLPPGEYKIDVNANGKTTSQVVTLTVGQVATLDLATGAAPSRDLESVTVSATRLFETKTSEVSSYVSLKQIEILPQSSRNFLEFADTIPGIQFQTNSYGSSELRAGGQSSNGVNVFIDGVGQKNYVSRGGVGGQGSLADGGGPDSRGTRGNPFPQLAIGEYKVITSNYKAEFDQLSSAAIVAATKSGTNEFEIDGFYDYTDQDWRASDPFEAEEGEKAPSEQEQYGAAIGGPIIKDRMHFFVTYEAKNFESPKRVFLGSGNGFNPASLQPRYAGFIGNFSQPFSEDLYFAKIDWTPGDAHLIELSAKIRDEEELTFGDNEPPEHGTLKDNQDDRYDLRYQYTGDFFLNDAHITYEDSAFLFLPNTAQPGFQLFNGLTDADNRLVLTYGGAVANEERSQKGYGFQDDITFNSVEWLGLHSIKMGVKFKKVDLAVRTGTPANPYYALDVNDTSADVIPWRVRFGAILPYLDDTTIESENKQYGIYLQDDWDLTDQLQVNLGIRYDYEETPGYLDYVTPADVVAAFDRQDTNGGSPQHPVAPPGQTYRQTLAKGGIDIDDFISTGNNRDAFRTGISPRFGFSYDIAGDQRHVVFGGAGRSYDRNVFEYMARETFKGSFPEYTRYFSTPTRTCPVQSNPGNCIPWDPAYYNVDTLEALIAANPQLGREVFMLENDIRTPYSDQFSLGMRNRVVIGSQDWLTSVTLAYVKSEDGIYFSLGNRWPDGQFRTPGTTWGGQPWGNGIPGLGSLIIGRNGMETRTGQLLLSLEKPYTSESGWGASFAYTGTDSEENRSNVASSDDTYVFDYPTPAEFGFKTSTGVPKHRLVATGIFDIPWEMTLSAKLQVATPRYYGINNCFNSPNDSYCYPDPVKPDTTIGYKQLDLAFQKQFTFADDFGIRLRADILNVFNWSNADRREENIGQFYVPNPEFMTVRSYYQPTRTFKLSFAANWR